MTPPGSVVTMGETMALLGAPASGRPRQRVVAAAGSRRGGVQRGDRAGPARRAVHLDQPGRGRRAGHVRHPGDPGRGRPGCGPAGSGGADRADVQGAPRRRGRGGSATTAAAARPRGCRRRTSTSAAAAAAITGARGAAPDRHHARARSGTAAPRSSGPSRSREPRGRWSPSTSTTGRPSGRTTRRHRCWRDWSPRPTWCSPGRRRRRWCSAGSARRARGRSTTARSWPASWRNWARPPSWSSSARSVRWPCPVTRCTARRPGPSPSSTRSVRATRFVAGYLSEAVADGQVAECLRMGNALGAAVCGIRGDWEGLPTREELAQRPDSRGRRAMTRPGTSSTRAP